MFEVECINPPCYLRDPAFMLPGEQLLKTLCLLSIGWIPRPTQEAVFLLSSLGFPLWPFEMSSALPLYRHPHVTKTNKWGNILIDTSLSPFMFLHRLNMALTPPWFRVSIPVGITHAKNISTNDVDSQFDNRL